VLNVRDFGAVGDGVTDDRAAIQACLNAAFGPVTAPHGNTNKFQNRPVYFPPGAYATAGRIAVLKINGMSRSRIEGLTFAASASSPNNPSLYNAVGYNWDGTGEVPATDNAFRDLNFGNLTYGLDIGKGDFQCDGSLIEKCVFTNCYQGCTLWNFNAINSTVLGGAASEMRNIAYYAPVGSFCSIIGPQLANNGIDIVLHASGGVSSPASAPKAQISLPRTPRRHWRCSFPIRFRIRRVPNLQQAAFAPFPRKNHLRWRSGS
jgi:hypothetical protein